MQQSMPDEEIDQHEIAVVFELVSVTYRLVHPFHGPQLERMDLAVVRLRSEIRRQLEVEAGHDIGLELPPRLIPVSDDADGLRLHGEFARDRGFLGALLDEVLEDADVRRLPARHGVVELAGIGRLHIGATRHPDVQAVALLHIARHVRTVGAHAEPRHRRALHLEQGRLVEVRRDLVRLLAPSLPEQATVAQLEQERAHRRGAPGRRVERSVEIPAAVAMAEQIGPHRDHGQEVAMQETRAHGADVPGLELAEVSVVATRDMIEKGHGFAPMFFAIGRRPCYTASVGFAMLRSTVMYAAGLTRGMCSTTSRSSSMPSWSGRPSRSAPSCSSAPGVADAAESGCCCSRS